MFRKNSIRLTRSSTLNKYGTLYLLAASFIVFGALYFIGISIDQNLAIVGLFFGLVQYVLSKYESKIPIRRSVIFLAKSKSSFAQNIYRGLRAELDSNQNITIDSIFPSVSSAPSDQLSWQIKEIASNPLIAKCDALVLIPARDDAELWQSLIPLAAKGITIIGIDTKPLGSMFDSAKLERPYFVGSNFTAGGDILSELIIGELNKEASVLIGALGPSSSWPAVERCSRLLISLARSGLLDKTIWIEFKSWNTDDCADGLLQALKASQKKNHKKFLVFCGNDKVAISFIKKVPIRDRDSVKVIGYDGLRDESDTIVLKQEPMFLATIDTLPIDQGKVAGSIIENLHHGERPNKRSYYVSPILIKQDISFQESKTVRRGK